MKQFGLKAGSTVAAGAMAGMTIDVISHMLTLGTATAIGAAIGGAIGIARTHGRRLVDRMRGYSELAVNDDTVRLLLVRQVALVEALLRRGHASLAPIRVGDQSGAGRAAHRLPAILDDIRLRPQWSRLQAVPNPMALSSQARIDAQDRLSLDIEQIVRP
jgi:hypothetical protein